MNNPLFLSPFFWLTAGLICLGLEIILPSFVFAVFGLSGIVTGLLAFFIKDIYILASIYGIFAVVVFVFLRPWYFGFVLKRSHSQKFGFNSLLNTVGVVKVEVSAGKPGYIKVDADEWRAFANETIEAGAQAKIIKLEGNTVWIEKIN
jgi:membrane protein implicated in regulation of membrane protease activity